MRRVAVFLVMVLVMLAGCSTTTPAPTNVPTDRTAPAPADLRADKPAPVPLVDSFAGLTVERYVLGNTSSLPDETTPILSSTLHAKRDPWHRTLGPAVDQYNRALVPFGYRIAIEDDPKRSPSLHYLLYRDGQVLYDAVDNLRSLSVNARGDDFVLAIELRGRSMLLRPGQDAVVWDMPAHEWTVPVFVGNDLVTVVTDEAQTDKLPRTIAFNVWRGSSKAYAMQFPWNEVTQPVQALWAWQDHWVLEVAGDVIIDGQSLKAARGYDEVFNWHVVAGKPFYLARNGKKISVVYDGQTAPDQYDDIPHNRCCSGGILNAGGNEFMVWFYGKKDGEWSYVEMGQYD